MGWLRNLIVFPDNVWELAAGKLDAEFVQGKWLANSEIRLAYHDVPVTLRVEFSTQTDRHTRCTRAILASSPRPGIKLLLYPRLKGIAGTLTESLLSAAGKEIDMPMLGGEYQVLGEAPEIAGRIFGDPRFTAKLKAMTTPPFVSIGGSLSSWTNERADEDEENLHVSIPNVVKDERELISMVDLTKVLLDLLLENECLE